MGQINYTSRGTGQRVANLPPLDELEGFGRVRVSKVTNRTEGADDEMGVAVWEIELEQDIPIEFAVDENLADWLRTNATWDIPGGRTSSNTAPT